MFNKGDGKGHTTGKRGIGTLVQEWFGCDGSVCSDAPTSSLQRQNLPQRQKVVQPRHRHSSTATGEVEVSEQSHGERAKPSGPAIWR